MSLIPFILDLAEELNEFNRAMMSNMDVDDFGHGLLPQDLQTTGQQQPSSSSSSNHSQHTDHRRPMRTLAQWFLSSNTKQRHHPYSARMKTLWPKTSSSNDNATPLGQSLQQNGANGEQNGNSASSSGGIASMNGNSASGIKTPFSIVNRNGFQVSMNVKQFTPDELNVKTINNCIIVEGRHEDKEDGHGVISRHFIRKYMLPKGYDPNDVESTLSSDGILTVKAPPPPPPQKTSARYERIVDIQHQAGPTHSLAVAGCKNEQKPKQPKSMQQQQQPSDKQSMELKQNVSAADAVAAATAVVEPVTANPAQKPATATSTADDDEDKPTTSKAIRITIRQNNNNNSDNNNSSTTITTNTNTNDEPTAAAAAMEVHEPTRAAVQIQQKEQKDSTAQAQSQATPTADKNQQQQPTQETKTASDRNETGNEQETGEEGGVKKVLTTDNDAPMSSKGDDAAVPPATDENDVVMNEAAAEAEPTALVADVQNVLDDNVMESKSKTNGNENEGEKLAEAVNENEKKNGAAEKPNGNAGANGNDQETAEVAVKAAAKEAAEGALIDDDVDNDNDNDELKMDTDVDNGVTEVPTKDNNGYEKIERKLAEQSSAETCSDSIDDKLPEPMAIDEDNDEGNLAIATTEKTADAEIDSALVKPSAEQLAAADAAILIAKSLGDDDANDTESNANANANGNGSGNGNGEDAAANEASAATTTITAMAADPLPIPAAVEEMAN